MSHFEFPTPPFTPEESLPTSAPQLSLLDDQGKSLWSVSGHTIIIGKLLLPFGTPRVKGVFPLFCLLLPLELSLIVCCNYYYYSKRTGSSYCLLLVEFLQLVISVATLLKSPGKHCLYLSSKYQLPLDPGWSSKWNFPGQTSPSFLILDLSANWPVILHSAWVICNVGNISASKIMRPQINTF